MKTEAWLPEDGTLVVKEIELGNPPRGVLVEIEAFGANRADLSQMRGLYPPPSGVTEALGLEFSGVVVKSFEGSKFKKGDRVMSLVQGGAYARRIRVEEELLIEIPTEVSFTDAAALPEAWCTVLLNLKEIGAVSKGETVLIHSATGSVGATAIQYTKYCGAYVIATTRSPEKIAFLKEMGADLPLLASELEAHSEEIIARGGVDFVLDSVGKDTFEINQQLVKHGGKVVFIGWMSGAKATINIATMLTKQQHFIGSTLRSQSLEVRAELTRDLEELMPFIIKKLPIAVSDIFSWEQTPDALQHMLENRNQGKIVIVK